MARWLKAEFLHCRRIVGFFILVDLLSGFMVGVGGVVMGFVIGVGFGDGWAGFVAGLGVMGGVWFKLHLVWGESGGGGGIKLVVEGCLPPCLSWLES